MALELINQIIQGALIGGLYVLFAIGLSLSLGVMRFVNIAHGDLIVLASFILMSFSAILGLSPFIAAALLMPVAFVAFYGLQRLLLQRWSAPICWRHFGHLRSCHRDPKWAAANLRP